MAIVAKYTEPLNSMVSKEQREYVDARAKSPGVSRADVVRRALDCLMESEPVLVVLDGEPVEAQSV